MENKTRSAFALERGLKSARDKQRESRTEVRAPTNHPEFLLLTSGWFFMVSADEFDSATKTIMRFEVSPSNDLAIGSSSTENENNNSN
jgi:hypothetical protein